MSKVELSAQDRKEIDNCIKHLVHKFVQTIVQSRRGDRIATHCKKLSSSSDWFNLTISDHSEVHDAVKHVFPGHVDLSQPLCVEISLRTPELEKMTLEYWYLQLTDKTSMPDSSFKVPLTVYNAIGVMLKSVIIVSRSTPVYQLSRRQKNDNFDICYNVCLRDPSVFVLGEDFERQLVGTVPSPLGAITSFLVYRTKLTTVPQQSIPDLTSTIKDDHFNHFNKPFCRNKTARHSREVDSMDNDMVLGTSPGHGVASAPMDVPRGDGSDLCQKRAAFGNTAVEGSGDANDVDIDKDVPFSTLLQLANSPPVAQGVKMPKSSDSNSREATESTRGVSSTDVRCIDSVAAVTATKDDFVMVELKAPFVGQEEDLGRFYRDCQMAPTLSMFEQTGSLQDMINSITDQLTQFEACANDFNEFVNSLQDIE